MKQLTLLLGGLLLSATGFAQDAGDPALDAAEPLRRYTVEVIIFAYAEDVSVGSELFVPDDPPEDPAFGADETDASVPVYGDDVAPADQPDADVAPRWVVVPELLLPDEMPLEALAAGGDGPSLFQLRLLDDDEMTLTRVADRFELLDVYDTLMHVGWVQPAYPEEFTPPIELSLLGNVPPGLDGTLTLYLSRYLHFIVDLALEAPPAFEAEVIADEDFPAVRDTRRRYGDAPRAPAPVVHFRIQEDRILKNGELRYFDHPKFGVLAKVTRIEQPGSAQTTP